MDWLIQDTQLLILEHPFECAVICAISVLATLTVQRWL